MLMIRNERPTWSRARGFKGWTDACVLIATLGLTELSLPGRNGQVHEAWEGGDGPSWTLRRAQSCHRQGETRKSFWKPSVRWWQMRLLKLQHTCLNVHMLGAVHLTTKLPVFICWLSKKGQNKMLQPYIQCLPHILIRQHMFNISFISRAAEYILGLVSGLGARHTLKVFYM